MPDPPSPAALAADGLLTESAGWLAMSERAAEAPWWEELGAMRRLLRSARYHRLSVASAVDAQAALDAALEAR